MPPRNSYNHILAKLPVFLIGKVRYSDNPFDVRLGQQSLAVDEKALWVLLGAKEPFLQMMLRVRACWRDGALWVDQKLSSLPDGGRELITMALTYIW